MLKEYLHEAVSLLTEAVLGKPAQALAGCIPIAPVPGSQCGSCGPMKNRWKFLCGCPLYCYEKVMCNWC